MKDLTDHCRQVHANNSDALYAIAEFEQKHSEHALIWWYSCEFFLYKMLNRTLRTLEVDIIIFLGFFIRDLCRQIKQLHTDEYGMRKASPFVVYRGQGMSNTDFDRLQQTKAV